MIAQQSSQPREQENTEVERATQQGTEARGNEEYEEVTCWPTVQCEAWPHEAGLGAADRYVDRLYSVGDGKISKDYKQKNDLIHLGGGWITF